MTSARFGIDRVFFTVTPIITQEYAFDKAAYQRFFHLLTRIKTDTYKTWGVRWNWDNVNDHNLMEETIALSKYRTMFVRANLMRIYMHEHDLQAPDNSFDDNVCPPDHFFTPDEFVSLLKRVMIQAELEYKKIYTAVFKEPAPSEILVRLHQIEVVGELMNVTILDIENTVLAQVTGKSIVRYHDETATLYVNPLIGESQLKFYQKNPSIFRQEVTLNGNDAKDLSDDLSLETLIVTTRHVLERFNFGWFWNLTKNLTLDERIGAWATFLHLDEAVLKNILEITSWHSTKATQNLTRGLVRRKLIKKLYKGTYEPTFYLEQIKKSIFQSNE